MAGIYAKIECALLDDPDVAAAGPMAELLYIRSILYCRQNLTDGVIARGILPRLSTGIPGWRKAVAQLSEKLWEECDEGYRIPLATWVKDGRNPLRADIEAAKPAKSDADTLGNHTR